MIRRDEHHRYWMGGQELISTTFAIKEAGFVDANTLQYGNVARGRAVHDIAQVEMTGDAFGEVDVDPRLVGFHEAICRFRDDMRAETLSAEKILALPATKSAGTIDWFGVLHPRGSTQRRVVIDWKTYPFTHWHRLQVGASYLPMVQADLTARGEDAAGIETLIVQLNNDGTYRLWPFTPDPSEAYVFRSAVATTLWRMKYGSRGKLYGRQDRSDRRAADVDTDCATAATR
jgi:hypothetical protein